MIHIGTRGALPTPAKAGKPMPEIKEEGLALLLAIVADINSRLRTVARTASRPALSIAASSIGCPFARRA
jgi:hypothetical protein